MGVLRRALRRTDQSAPTALRTKSPYSKASPMNNSPRAVRQDLFRRVCYASSRQRPRTRDPLSFDIESGISFGSGLADANHKKCPDCNSGVALQDLLPPNICAHFSQTWCSCHRKCAHQDGMCHWQPMGWMAKRHLLLGHVACMVHKMVIKGEALGLSRLIHNDTRTTTV